MLSDLVVYCRSVPFGTEKEKQFLYMSSLAEGSVNSKISNAENQEKVLQHAITFQKKNTKFFNFQKN